MRVINMYMYRSYHSTRNISYIYIVFRASWTLEGVLDATLDEALRQDRELIAGMETYSIKLALARAKGSIKTRLVEKRGSNIAHVQQIICRSSHLMV